MPRTATLLALFLISIAAHAQPSQENLFTHLSTRMGADGRPWMDNLSGDFWECMGVNRFANAFARAEVEAVFHGQQPPDEAFFDAARTCGLLALAAPWDVEAQVQTRDLGFPITYQTPGITAVNDPFNRPPGVEQLADPSAVQLPDGRIVLYFAGDHRAAFQSTRWVSKSPIHSIEDPLEFEPEADYNLPTRLLWRQMFLLQDGSWRAFGNHDGIRSWDSSDGLDWTESTTPQVLVPPAADVRTQLGLSPNVMQFDSFLNITLLPDGSWVGVMPHYLESMEAPQPDPNGNGYNDPPYVLIYQSSDGFTWEYRSVLIGPAEGFVTQLATDVFMFTMSDAVLFSRDLESWTFGHAPHFHSYGVTLPDGWILHFGTDSRTGIPVEAFRTTFDPAMLPEAQWKLATWATIPSIEELRGEVSGVGTERTGGQPAFRMDLYPNPSRGRIQVEWTAAGSHQNAELTVLDLSGRTLHHARIAASGPGDQRTQMDLEVPASGVYFVRLAVPGQAPRVRPVMLLR